jgi:hypothetical protein
MTDPAIFTFPNPRITKAAFVAALREHRAADRIVAGTYDGIYDAADAPPGAWIYGCAVGCSLRSCAEIAGIKITNYSDHARYEPLIGVPEIIARLEDRIFEGLTGDAQLDWPVRFGEALPEGADLSMVWPRFALWLLSEEVPQRTIRGTSLAALADVATLYSEWCAGTKPAMNRWVKARENVAAYADAAAAVAYAIAADAAAAVAYAAAAAAAYAVAYATAAYADAAVAVAYAYAYADAQVQCYERQADKLIEIIQACGHD